MLAGTVLYIHLLVYAGLSLFIKSGLYVYMVVCIVHMYNLTSTVQQAIKAKIFTPYFIHRRV